MLKLNLIFILATSIYSHAGFGFIRPISMQRTISGDAFYLKMMLDSFFIVLENKWLNALQENDTAYLNQLLDSDFIGIRYKGTVRTKEDVLHKRVYNKNDISQQLTRYKSVQV
jgi:hypothetical protein